RRALLRAAVRFRVCEPIESLASRSFARRAKRKIQSLPGRKRPTIGAKTTHRWRPPRELRSRLLTDSANDRPPKSRPSPIWRGRGTAGVEARSAVSCSEGERVNSCRQRPRKPLIHLCPLICLGQRADSFFEKKPEEDRWPGQGGRRRKQTFDSRS